MEHTESSVVAASERPQHEWAKLIRKLRWIGSDDEAQRLEQAMNNVPAEKRCGVMIEPDNTD
jgi:hypothetical protein